MSLQALFDVLARIFGAKPKTEDTPKSLPEAPQEPSQDEKPVRPGDQAIDQAEDHEEYRGLLEKEPEIKTPEEWGLDKVELALKSGDRGANVKEFQTWLDAIGYDMPRFGADGVLGEETLSATRSFQDAHDLTEAEDALKVQGVGVLTHAAVKEVFDKLPKAPPKPVVPPPPVHGIPTITLSEGVTLYDVRAQHAGTKRVRRRAWKDVSGITLHQTATNFGNDPMRYRNIAAHIGVTHNGRAVLMNDLDWVVHHGHAFNARDVGIEIDGHFAGVEGNLQTYWRPASQPNRQPMSVSDAQVRATLATIEWIMKTVEAHGGKIKYIHVHRQSSKMRSSDPGSKVWQTIGLIAKERWGLIDGGPTFSIGGYTIPREWDPAYTDPYRQW